MHSRRWLIAAVVAWALGSACSQYNTNLSIQTSSSSLFFLGPQTATAGGNDFTITASGTGFVTGAFILWNGSQLSDTTFVSSTVLTATVPASDIATPGTVSVSVQIPGSAVSGASSTSATTTTEVSNIVNFTINPAPGPLPVISSISASTTSMPSTPYCSPDGFTLSVGGTNFTNDSAVNWNGSARATTFVSSTQLTASILATDAAFPGTAGVSVSTASGASNSMPFTMTTPAASLPTPSITSLSQTSVPAGSPALPLTVTGGSFVPCSVVQWSGSPRATSFVSATQLNATILPTDVFTAGTANVTVTTPTPGGGTTGPITFTITP
jgi:hypothetical protein